MHRNIIKSFMIFMTFALISFPTLGSSASVVPVQYQNYEYALCVSIYVCIYLFIYLHLYLFIIII